MLNKLLAGSSWLFPCARSVVFFHCCWVEYSSIIAYSHISILVHEKVLRLGCSNGISGQTSGCARSKGWCKQSTSLRCKKL
jgi:hypothetical protein